MSTYPKSRRVPGGIRSFHGTPVWHVYGESDRGLALGAIWRSADGKTWEARYVVE
jgi:hypothetical protein